jgi:hypothetical protein
MSRFCDFLWGKKLALVPQTAVVCAEKVDYKIYIQENRQFFQDQNDRSFQPRQAKTEELQNTGVATFSTLGSNRED